MSERPVLHVAAAILRRGDDVVLVHQGAPGEPLHWSLPGGILEEGELVTEAVVREVRGGDERPDRRRRPTRIRRPRGQQASAELAAEHGRAGWLRAVVETIAPAPPQAR